MIFSWFKERRRREILTSPFPAEWTAILNRHVRYYHLLSVVEQEKLRHDLRIMVAEKHWEGCGGLVMTAEIQVTIAAQACLLLLGFEDGYYFDNVESILVYPAGYTAVKKTAAGNGIIDEERDYRLGEAWQTGPVVLSWSDALDGGHNIHDGQNVVLHEFAHKLDMRDGRADGVPQLKTQKQYNEWSDVMSAEYNLLRAQSENGHATLLNQYGATNAGEFFAVATEAFFEMPRHMQELHPRLYDVLRRFYWQDPARRVY